MARRRFEYVLTLKEFISSVAPGPLVEVSWRNPTISDKQILADLMLAAYYRTIDYDGETIQDALKEVESYYAGISSQLWLRYSWLAFSEDDLAGACLVGYWQKCNAPLIAYIMTAPRWKGKHLATAALLRSLQNLADEKYTEVRAVITEGNTPSEKIFARAGFRRVRPD